VAAFSGHVSILYSLWKPTSQSDKKNRKANQRAYIVRLNMSQSQVMG